ncbi:hypothetical protein BXT84_12675 [Sulfobacillus thermotolerans]|uniref:HEPN domain-containing protein n=1 Tax=Sulfobacillus thermotolerans TaxID=338644 RepID=A0ABN5H202_9FIRM|nr:hypothetical protein BXT84_12675 [Sulfobacillus thermotolerans]
MPLAHKDFILGLIPSFTKNVADIREATLVLLEDAGSSRYPRCWEITADEAMQVVVKAQHVQEWAKVYLARAAD